MTNASSTRLAVYPGTFDPVTNGHVSLIERALQLFDFVLVAIADNAGKNPLFSVDERMDLVSLVIKQLDGNERVRVERFGGLLAHFVREKKAAAIIRGLRAISDFEYEFQMALMNRKLASEVETVFLMPSLSWVYLSSSIVKDVGKHGGDISDLVPAVTLETISERLQSVKQ